MENYLKLLKILFYEFGTNSYLQVLKILIYEFGKKYIAIYRENKHFLFQRKHEEK